MFRSASVIFCRGANANRGAFRKIRNSLGFGESLVRCLVECTYHRSAADGLGHGFLDEAIYSLNRNDLAVANRLGGPFDAKRLFGEWLTKKDPALTGAFYRLRQVQFPVTSETGCKVRQSDRCVRAPSRAPPASRSPKHRYPRRRGHPRRTTRIYVHDMFLYRKRRRDPHDDPAPAWSRQPAPTVPTLGELLRQPVLGLAVL